MYKIKSLYDNKLNLQQVPARGDLATALRKCFIEREGYSIISADFASCELAIIANFSEDELWMNAINNKEDLHGKLAALTFEIPLSDVKQPTPFNKDMTYRDVQKTINFGLSYGMTEHKLSITMKVSTAYALQVITKFFSFVPKVKRYLESLGNTAVVSYVAKTPAPYYRIRRFEKTSDMGERERAGKNMPIQGCNADITKRAMVYIYNDEFKKQHNILLLLPIHDDILTRAKDNIAEEWAERQSMLMERAASEIVKNVKIRAEAKVSKVWSK